MVTRTTWIGLILAAGVAAAQVPTEPGSAKWVRIDTASRGYTIKATKVSRGALLDEFLRLTKTDIRPQPARDELISVDVRGLPYDEALARLLPAGTRVVVRPGDRELAVPPIGRGTKKGEALRPAPGSIAKSKTPKPITAGTLKVPPSKVVDRSVTGTNVKPDAASVARVHEPGPKEPLQKRAELATIRLTLEFTGGDPPRLIAAQAIEGRAPVERFVTGTILFALLDKNGRPVQFGTFQDPLTEHSYLENGHHDVRRAEYGVAGISILRENVGADRLVIVDAANLALPRELNEEVVGYALKSGKVISEISTAQIARALNTETIR